MWIHRRPPVSTVSTWGVSGSAGRETTSPRARADRPKRGLGRLGIGTSRVVAHRFAPGPSVPAFRLASAVPLAILPRHIVVRIQRGGGTGPMKPRQPLATAGKVPIPAGSNVSLGDVAKVFWNLCPHPG